MLGDQKLLNKLCSDLVDFKITTDEVLQDEELVVTSTDVSGQPPKKKIRSKKIKVVDRSAEIIVDIDKANSKARKLFSVSEKCKDTEDSDSDSNLYSAQKKLKLALEEIERLKRASLHGKYKTYSSWIVNHYYYILVSSDSSFEGSYNESVLMVNPYI